MSEEKKINIEDGNLEEENKSENTQAEETVNNEQQPDDAQTEETPAEEEKDPLDAALAEIENLKSQMLYKQAEFENYRKRTIKEKAELILNGGEKTITAILPVLDDFERALADKTDDPKAIKEGMDEIQNVKTLIHEMAHAKLHNMTAQKKREDGGQTKSSKEVEAESVAYTVCQHYGIDTSDYSFGYIAGWSGGKEMPELKASLDTIRTASSELISRIDEKLQEISREQNPVTLSDQIDRLAADLDQYSLDRDPYGYQDAVENREDGIGQIREQLEKGELSGIRESIRQDLVEAEGSEDALRETAETLLSRLDALQKKLDEGRENIADEKTNLNPAMPEKASGEAASCREAQKEEGKAVQKAGRMAGQHGKTSILQKLSEEKERMEKKPDQSRSPRKKAPER